MFVKPIQPIGFPDSDTLKEHCCMFFHSSTNSFHLPVQLMFIHFDSHDINDKNLGKWDSTTQTVHLQDVDVIFCSQDPHHRGRATMLSKILVKVVL